MGVLLFKPEETVITDIKTAAQAKAFFQEEFPQFMPLLREEEFEKFAKKKVRGRNGRPRGRGVVTHGALGRGAFALYLACSPTSSGGGNGRPRGRGAAGY